MPDQYRDHCRLLKKRKEQTEGTKNNAGNENKSQTNSNLNINIANNSNNEIHLIEFIENCELSAHFVRYLAKRTIPQRNALLELLQPPDRLLRIEVEDPRTKSESTTSEKAKNTRRSVFQGLMDDRSVFDDLFPLERRRKNASFETELVR